jgi:hypothetical protein
MPDIIVEKNSGAGNTVLGFILGGVMVAVAIVGFFMWDNFKSHGGQSPAAVHVTVKPK